MSGKMMIGDLVLALPNTDRPCAWCGGAILPERNMIVLMDPKGQPICQQCIGKVIPELLQAVRTAYIMAREDRRSELLREQARRQPVTFWEYELFTRERGGPEGAPLTKDLSLEMDRRAELLDAKSAVTVMIPHGVEADLAAKLVEVVAHVIGQRGYPTHVRPS